MNMRLIGFLSETIGAALGTTLGLAALGYAGFMLVTNSLMAVL